MGTAQHTASTVVQTPFTASPFSVGTVSAPGMGSAGCRTFVELNLSGALDARHHQGDSRIVSGDLCQRCGTAHYFSEASRASTALSSLRYTSRQRFRFVGLNAVIAACTTEAASSGGKP